MNFHDNNDNIVVLEECPGQISIFDLLENNG
mgnify:FL=1